jgi:alkylation response protein AidB-like acyl-CoA dehydrogenase
LKWYAEYSSNAKSRKRRSRKRRSSGVKGRIQETTERRSTDFAKTNGARGARVIYCFVLERGSVGFEFEKKENGYECIELIFSNCKVHKDQLLGKEGHGLMI